MAGTKVSIETSHGKMTLELFDKEAPLTVKNFLDYIDAGHYEGTIFHRVIKGFMIQGGGMTPDMKQKATKAPVKNEAANGKSNKRGTVAMARTSVIDSATSQFFINAVDNAFLDHQDTSARGFGYCVFGQVTEGLDVMDKIIAVKTGFKAGHDDVPVEPVMITKMTRV